MRQYLQLLSDVLATGTDRMDRTGTGTRSLFGYQMRFDLAAGFPLLTTKKLHIRSIIYELLWFLRGDTNVRYLQEHGVKIWDAWADEKGDLGPVYGSQWRSWPDGKGGHLDQIANVIESIRHKPESRRHIVTAWNPAEVAAMALPPCEFIHTFGDVHLYSNHFEQAREQLQREPRPLPRLTLNPELRDIFGFQFEDFQITGYDPLPHIKAEVAV